ncbi:non-homologous end joining protein Ku [Methylacidiphilum caldifontis]|uniref:Non-homologous end joining protein Ku n=1 Tax=Methylacidiphilum caldifontis TaxID=2795386 RepID=A0A4Y8PHC0_9BACT|nr:Ku protein [Methylacidiphilum caldifontis]TFE72060.1 Ku protein [Methylacidiphilum caldifontis]
MRALWKGTISFGLVTIPVKLYPAVKTEPLRFKFLRSSDLSPITNKRIAVADNKEVPWDQVVRGYEYEKGKFVILKDEDFDRVDIEAIHTVRVLDFVVLAEIDPVYFEKPYYLVPDQGGEKAYQLLHYGLVKTGKTAIAKIVLHNKEHLAALKPKNSFLTLELMYFQREIVDPKELPIPPKAELDEREKKITVELIEKMSVPWDPNRYQDEYSKAIEKIIKEKIKKGAKEIPKETKLRKGAAKEQKDLISLLEESLRMGNGRTQISTASILKKERKTRKKKTQ